MARKESGTVRPTKRKRVFFAAAVLLLVCVLAAGAVSAVEVSNFQKLQDAINSANGDTTIVVTNDILIGANDAIPAITTNIILTTTAGENHRIYRTAENTSYQSGMFTIQNGGNLTIRGNTSGTLTLDGNQTEVSDNGQTLVWINSGGNFTLNSGGVLTNNNVTGQSASGTEQKNSGAVYVNSGMFTMNGGEISNNTVGNSGGGVYVFGGTFTMNDGEIFNNTAGTNGGGVCISTGTFTMNGGTITNNTATGGNGGGVYLISGSTFTMNGGTITNNTAGSGNGGGVDVRTDSTFTMSGGTITGNAAKCDESSIPAQGGLGNGGGVGVNAGGTFTLSGGTISDNGADINGTGVYVGGVFNIQESGTVNGVYLPKDKNITVTGNLNDAAQVTGIIPADPQKDLLVVDLASVTEDYLTKFTLDDSVENFALKYQQIEPRSLVLTPTYTVTFNADGGTPVPDTQTVNHDDTVDEPVPTPTKEGYTLEGWYNYSVKWNFTTDVVNENIILKANWTLNTYTVTFEAYDGTPVPESQTVNHGGTVSEPDDPTKDGHTFAGWHEDASFITPWDFAAPVTKDLILHAKWTPNKPDPEPPSGGGSSDGNMDNAYRVLFNDGATTLYIVTDLSAGDKLTKPEDPVKDGYTFAGWHKDTACTQPWDFNDGITGSMTLYAKWTPQETVTPTATATPTVTATATITSTPTGDASPAPTSQPDTNGNSGDTTNGETTKTSGISLSYLIGGIAILLLAILLLLILLLRHTVTFLIPTGGEITEHRIKVWHGRYINTEDLPALIRTAAWYRDPARQERWDFDQDRVKKSIELYLG